MPKNKSTDAIIEKLSPADATAAEAKRAALATIPDPVWVSDILRSRTYCNRDFNVRDEESYATGDNKVLRASLKEKGLEKRGDSMCFHEEPDGRLLVLVGNLRWHMMDDLDKEQIADAAKEGKTINPDDARFGHIFGLVYKGLTEGQKTAIMADHLGRKTLNEFEKCKEVCDFVEHNGLSYEQASIHFGIGKNTIQRYCMRGSMPTVMAEYRKEKAGKEGESYIVVGQEALAALYSAYLKDRKGGNKHRDDSGPFFRMAWEKLKSDPNVFKKTGKKETPVEGKDRKTILEQASAQIPASGDGFEVIAIVDTLRYAAGDDVSLNEVRNKAVAEANKLRDEIKRIGTERDSFAETIADLTAKLQEANAQLAKASKPNRPNGHSHK